MPFEKVVVAFAFGSPSSLLPNALIAHHALQTSGFGKLRIFTQWDVPLQKYSGIHFFDNEMPGITTLQLIKSLYKELNTITRGHAHNVIINLVAAPPHKNRVIRDLRMMGFEVETDNELETKYPSSTWFDHRSTQMFTSHPLFWWPRELTLRALPWRMYKKITG